MRDGRHDLTNRERRKRDRRIWRTALLSSLLFHLLVFMGWRGQVIPESPFAAAGPKAGDFRTAGGSMQAMNIQTPTVRPIVPPPVPLEVSVDIDPVEFEPDPAFDPAQVLGDAPGQDAGPGTENGQGRGDGGNAEEGLNRLQPPSPRGMIIPPSNSSLKGTTVEVWVFVDARGRVVADSTRLNPPTRDRGFNQRLIREAAEWVFRPAMKAGEAVASWFPYQISM